MRMLVPDSIFLTGFIAKHVGVDVLLAKQVSHVNKNKHDSCVLALSRHRVILYNCRTKRVSFINFAQKFNIIQGDPKQGIKSSGL